MLPIVFIDPNYIGYVEIVQKQIDFFWLFRSRYGGIEPGCLVKELFRQLLVLWLVHSNPSKCFLKIL